MAKVATRLAPGLEAKIRRDLAEYSQSNLKVRASRSQLAHHPTLPPIHKRSHSADGSLSERAIAGSDDDALEIFSAAEGTGENNARPLLISLRVCKECQNALLRAFDHCLAKRGDEPIMQSVYEIDEVQDAQQLTEPPYFKIVKDPTKPKNTVYTDVSEKVERERWAFYEKRKAALREHPGNLRTKPVNGAGRGSGIAAGTVFSGALYKRVLDVKDKEIQMLREQLYDRTMSEKLEHGDVDKLRAALKKAVNYYVFAEEWQAVESARLQQDVRQLKAELSSLMAFLINSEEEKRKVTGHPCRSEPLDLLLK